MRTRLMAVVSLLLGICLLGAGPAHASPVTGAPAGSATSAEDYSSIFAGPHAELAGSGWAACPAPIAWTVDTRGLTPAQQRHQIANLQWAFSAWSAVSGLAFAYAGSQTLTYDDAAFRLTPADGSALEPRHIYLDFVSSEETGRLKGGTVGLGTPSQVLASTKQIVDGDAVFRTDHVQRASTIAVRSLYLHELGHVLGLAHASVQANVMYPVVTDHAALGAGDINGVRAMTKACPSA